MLWSMRIAPPQHCRPEAYERFAAQLGELDSACGLLRAAAAVAMHELGDGCLEETERELSQIVDRIHARVRTSEPRAVAAHAHDVLFEELEFTGNAERYYEAHNSYVPRVLQTRRGLPITLSLVYHCVMHRLGVKTVGINAPLHFMVGLEIDDSRLYIDPFFGGKALNEAEAIQRIATASGRPVTAGARELLPEATHEQWLARILKNLANLFAVSNRKHDAAAMIELGAMLRP